MDWERHIPWTFLLGFGLATWAVSETGTVLLGLLVFAFYYAVVLFARALCAAPVTTLLCLLIGIELFDGD